MVNRKPRVVLFLDIDGVLNSHRFWLTTGKTAWDVHNSRWSDDLDPMSIGVINRVAERYDAQIVISSSWRFITGFEETKAILAQNGLDVSRVIDKTGPELDKNPTRSEEITRWVFTQDDIDAWIAVDDSDTMKNIPFNSFHVPPVEGLTDEHEEKMLNIIKVQLERRYVYYKEMVERHMDDISDEIDRMVDWIVAYEEKE